jgi:exosome complex RNA-binding protein Rrp42 (RNase PH superfamily)
MQIRLKFTYIAFFLTVSIDFSESIVVDLTEREENCTDGTILIAANKRQEICALHCNGTIAMQKQLV